MTFPQSTDWYMSGLVCKPPNRESGWWLIRSTKHSFDVGEEAIDLTGVESRRATISWGIEVPGLPVERVRDPRAPGWAAVAAMISAAAGSTPRAVRDRAILWLLIGLGLRRAEVASLDLAHYEGERLRVLGKGRRQRDSHSLPVPVQRALNNWIAIRGDAPGPLFVNLDRAQKSGAAGDRRLSGRAIHQLVGYWAQRAGSADRCGRTRSATRRLPPAKSS